MTIDNIKIKKVESRLICVATVISNNWCRINNIVYRCGAGEWLGDYAISDNVKKMCRREWYKMAKEAGLSRKKLSISI